MSARPGTALTLAAQRAGMPLAAYVQRMQSDGVEHCAACRRWVTCARMGDGNICRDCTAARKANTPSRTARRDGR